MLGRLAAVAQRHQPAGEVGERRAQPLVHVGQRRAAGTGGRRTVAALVAASVMNSPRPARLAGGPPGMKSAAFPCVAGRWPAYLGPSAAACARPPGPRGCALAPDVIGGRNECADRGRDSRPSRRVPAWQRQGDSIVMTVTRADFRDALLYVGAVAFLAEAANHHPDIAISWNKVTLTLSTHWPAA